MKLLAFIFLLLTCVEQAYATTVHIVLSDDSDAYQAISEQLKTAIKLESPAAAIKVSSLTSFHSSQLADKDLILTVGNQAAQAVSKTATKQPLILSFTDQQLIPDSNNWVAPVVSHPIERLTKAMDEVIDKQYKNRVLIVVASENKHALEQLERLPAMRNGMVEVIQLDRDEKPAKVIEDKLFNAGALIAINDQRIWSGENARWLLFQAYRYRVPVVGYSKKFLTAGALLSVYSTSQQIIHTTTTQVTSWLTHGRFTSNGVIYSDYNIEYNQNIARALDITVPENQFELRTSQ